MWLPRPIYEALPYAYGLVGLGLFGAAWWLERGPRGWLLAGGAVAMTLALVLWMRRRDYRSTNAEYDARSLDE